MKKTLLKVYLPVTFIVLAVFTCFTGLKAQVINEGFEEGQWVSPGNQTSGSLTVSSTTSTMTYFTNSARSSSSFTTNAAYAGTFEVSSTAAATATKTSYTISLTSSGLNTSPNSGTWYYSSGNTSSDTKLVKAHSNNKSWQLNQSGYLITPVINGGIVTVTFWANSSGSGNIFVGANTATGNPPPTNYATKSSSNGFTMATQNFAVAGGSMVSYSYNTVITAANAQIGIFSALSSSVYLDDIIVDVNSGSQVSVSTGASVTPITQTTATVTGNITASSTTPNAIVIYSGICYTTSGTTVPDTSGPHSTDGPTNVTGGSISTVLTGLLPNTNYCASAYAVTTAGVVYGNKVCFNTLASTAPVVATTTVNPLSSVSATCGGNVSDSGGLLITKSGVCWNTTGNPTTSDNVSTDGNSSSYTSFMAGLLPCTKYYVRAYATNSKGTTYGAELSFTTACVPSLLASPATLNFGLVPIGSSATMNYTLTGALLSPASGNITVTAPAGCLISLPGGTPKTTITIPYSGAALAPTKIIVTFSPSKYGYVTDSVLHSGGGAVAPNVQQVAVNGLGSQPAGVYSNVGIDFWTGFGYVEEMSNNKANMSVYVAAGDQDAVVNIDIPGLGWSSGSPITVLAHTVTEVNNFPKNTPDSRLYFTGVTGRAVHVQSTNGVPVSVWTYTSAGDNTAAGCMNFPTNTWNSQYTVQAFGGFSNQPYPNSYFFVIANEDSTDVTITPTADIVDSNANTIFKDNTTGFVKYPSGVPFTVKLNKGEVFTGISTLSGTGTGIGSGKAFSADLSGTKVSTDCRSKKKIAVFGGNGRCLVDTSTIQNPPNFQTVNASTGSDNLMQQMFPNSAWGTKYLSVPTKTMEDNYYRIYVQDSTITKVTVNGILLDTATLVNKLYYQLSGSSIATGDLKPYDTVGNHFLAISASNPVSVSQFIVAGAISTDKSASAAAIGNNGKGDPEMIILSPIQQSINSVTVATPRFQNNLSGGNYINVVIPKKGVKSFRIYNDTTTTSWKTWRLYTDSVYHTDTINHLPFDPTNLANAGYSYKIFNDTLTQLVDTGATSYVAGMAYQSSPTLVFRDSAFMPYPTDSNYSYARFKVTIGNSYTMYSDSGFNAIAYGMDAGESYGFNAGTNLKVINFTPGRPHIKGATDTSTFHVQQEDFSVIKSCLSIPSHYSIALSFIPDSLVWNFDIQGVPNGNISPNNAVHQIAPIYDSTHKYPGDTSLYYNYTIKDASGKPINYTFNKVGTYPLKVTAYTKSTTITFFDPCTVDTTNGIAKNTYDFTIEVTTGVHPNFAPKYASCSTDTLYKFFDNTWDENSTDTSFIIGRIWNFGNGKSDTANRTTVTTTYLSSGLYPVRLIAVDKIGCVFDTTSIQSIKLKPAAKFTVSTDTICAGSSVTFIDQSSTIGKGVLDGISTYSWNYGNGTNTFADSARRANQYNQFGTYPVTLKVTNGVGCDSTYTFKSIFVSANPVANFIFPNDVCLNAVANFTNKSTIADGSSLNYVWDFGDATKKDSVNKDASHSYGSYGPYNVSLTAYNAIGCSNTTTQVFDVLYSLIPLAVGQDYQEGFESQTYNTNPNYFPPVAPSGQRWHVTQSPVDAITWDRAVDIANNIVPSEGKACAWINNFAYAGSKQNDDLNTPVFGLPKYDGIYDSLLLKFDVAAKSTAAIGDTLEVLMSTDCNSWQTIYKKWGLDLLTVHDGSQNTAGEFKVNDKKYWRTDSINITASTTLGGAYAHILQTGGNDIRFKFRSHNNNENNIYLDNINLYVLRPNGVGFNTTTIPFDTALSIRYNYPPTDLKRLTIYDMTGRLIHVINYNNSAPRVITLRPGFNGIPYMANGMYVVVMEYVDKPKAVFNFLKQ